MSQQLELPPISFARYLELLRRRRWQVIPMSLVGLLIGAFVAFLIPRYYVASTKLTYQGMALDPASRSDEDPLLAKVTNASTSIPVVVEDALEALERIGTDRNDPARQQAIDDVGSRLSVETFNTDQRRGFYNIVIEYKDTDGQFAARFCNELRNVWVNGIRTELETEASAELRSAREDVAAFQQARDLAVKALESHIAQYHIVPFDLDPRTTRENSLTTELGRVRGDLAQVDGEIARHEARIQRISGELELLEPDTEVQVPIKEESEISRELNALLLKKAEYEAKIAGAREGHPKLSTYRQWLAHIDAQIAALVPGVQEGGMITRTEANPRYQELVVQRNDAEVELAGNRARLESLRARERELTAELAQIPTVFATYEDLRSRRADADEKHRIALERERQLSEIYERTTRGDPFKVPNEAVVPPAPTEPNVTLVAITGAIVGLGAAIGLVLLLDFLRSTFKTVDDVTFALKVPVLGTLAYIETLEARREAVRYRRRVSLVAATFLVLSLSLVTVYYIAPTRLPTVVLDALESIFGAPQ
ncbi:MAG: hypothetical protein IPM29_16745 [Planctomycetes bacterium]|nr:hypothetical protein [Planctomycetota bacterium]